MKVKLIMRKLMMTKKLNKKGGFHPAFFIFIFLIQPF
jgi:hypothetical protein